MRLTLTTKITLGLGVVVGLGVLSMAIIAAGLKSVTRSLEEMSDDKEPRSAAVYEMEINVNGFGLAVLKYQYRADPRFRALAEEDERDFARFHALFMTLADSPQEWRLGETIGKLFREYRKTGHVLIRTRDRQERVFADIGHALDRMDGRIDGELQPHVRDGVRRLPQLEAVLDLEADLAEIGHALSRYRLVRSVEHRRQVRRETTEARATLARLRALPLAAPATRALDGLRRDFDATAELVRDAVMIESAIQRRSLRLTALREEIDRLLDTELQVLSSINLSRPRRAGVEAARHVTGRVWVLLPLFFVAAVVVARVMRAVLSPLEYLMHGTRQVAAGNLGHRVVAPGNDELADLGRAFNRMVAELEATTVSKTRLETSERELASTVAALRHEMTERQRAGEERAKLEASLRRSEVMSAMGGLVAGVAHEVRTPLFGISSVVDALEARLERSGQRALLGTHLDVLRGEVERLSRVMHDLIEFGRPVSGERVDAALADVVREAVAICRGQAERAGVTLHAELSDEPFVLAMRRERLLQVFRNVVENAIQHSPSGGTVRVALTRRDDATDPVVECVVSDTGDGIVPDDVPHLFDPFFSRRKGGTGLGLAIAQRIVEEHHGTMTARNGVVRGAEFTIRLPLAVSEPGWEVAS